MVFNTLVADPTAVAKATATAEANAAATATAVAIAGATSTAAAILTANAYHYTEDNKVSANIQLVGTGTYAAGLAGRISGTTKVSGNYFKGTVSTTAGTGIAGLFGLVDSTASANDNMAEATVSGDTFVGGIAANINDANSRIHRALFIGTTSGNSTVSGGVAAAHASQTLALNNKLTFLDPGCGSASGCVSGIATGYNATNLKLRSTFHDANKGWFLAKGDTWWIDNTVDYPRLWRLTCQGRWDNVTNSSGFAGGTGVLGDPYQINAIGQVPLMANNLAGYYKLTADIDVNNDCLKLTSPIGNNATPFTGNFDGNSKMIDGINLSSSVDYSGLFGKLSGATIQNFTLKGYNYRTANLGNAGLFAGYTGTSTLTNVDVEGRVESSTADSAFNATGLLSGQVISSTVTNSDVAGSIYTQNQYVGLLTGYILGSTISQVTAAGNPVGGQFLGGIVGMLNGTISLCTTQVYIIPAPWVHFIGGVAGYQDNYPISRCSSSGTIIGSSVANHYVGGISGKMGQAGATTTNSYSSVNVAGAGNVGGIAGEMNTNPTLTNVYSVGTVSAASNGGQGVGLLSSSGALTKVYTLDQNGDCATPFVSATNTGGCADANGVVEMSATELKTQSTFTGAGVNWDFATIWTSVDGVSYPTLR